MTDFGSGSVFLDSVGHHTADCFDFVNLLADFQAAEIRCDRVGRCTVQWRHLFFGAQKDWFGLRRSFRVNLQ